MEAEKVRCICGYTEDDGYTIQCEKCLVWQHVVCVNLTKSTVPEHYFCEECNPRWLNVERAIRIQSDRMRLKRSALEDKRKRKEQPEILKPSPRRRKDSFSNGARNDKPRKPRPRDMEKRVSFSEMSPSMETLDASNSEDVRQNNAENSTGKKRIAKKRIQPRHDYEAEYHKFANNRQASVNRFINKEVEQEVLDLMSEWADLLPVSMKQLAGDLFEELPDFLVLRGRQVHELSSFIEMDCVYTSPSTNISEFSLFATGDIPAKSVLAEIKGTIISDVHGFPGLLSACAVPSDGQNQLLYPPFVFPFSVSKADSPRYYLDAREFGKHSKLLRFHCGIESIASNAKLVTAHVPHDPSPFGEYHSEKLKMVVVSTAPLTAGSEVICALGENQLAFPCICTNEEECRVWKAIEALETDDMYMQIDQEDVPISFKDPVSQWPLKNAKSFVKPHERWVQKYQELKNAPGFTESIGSPEPVSRAPTEEPADRPGRIEKKVVSLQDFIRKKSRVSTDKIEESTLSLINDIVPSKPLESPKPPVNDLSLFYSEEKRPSYRNIKVEPAEVPKTKSVEPWKSPDRTSRYSMDSAPGEYRDSYGYSKSPMKSYTEDVKYEYNGLKHSSDKMYDSQSKDSRLNEQQRENRFNSDSYARGDRYDDYRSYQDYNSRYRKDSVSVGSPVRSRKEYSLPPSGSESRSRNPDDDSEEEDGRIHETEDPPRRYEYEDSKRPYYDQERYHGGYQKPRMREYPDDGDRHRDYGYARPYPKEKYYKEEFRGYPEKDGRPVYSGAGRGGASDYRPTKPSIRTDVREYEYDRKYSTDYRNFNSPEDRKPAPRRFEEDGYKDRSYQYDKYYQSGRGSDYGDRYGDYSRGDYGGYYQRDYKASGYRGPSNLEHQSHNGPPPRSQGGYYYPQSGHYDSKEDYRRKSFGYREEGPTPDSTPRRPYYNDSRPREDGNRQDRSNYYPRN